MQENDKFKHLLGNKLHDFEAVPPAGMWSRIESGLQRRKRRILLFRTSSIAASIILLAGLGISYLNSPDLFESNNKSTARIETKNDSAHSGKSNDLASNEVKNKNKEKKSLTPNNKNVPSDKQNKKSGTVNKSKRIYRNRTTTGNFAETSETASNKLVADNIQNDVNTGQQNAITVDGNNISAENQEKTEAQSFIQPLNQPTPEELALILNPPVTDAPEEVSSKGDWSLGLAYAVSSGADFTKESAALDEGGREYSYDEFSASIANGTSYFEEVENAIHDAPLSIGFTVDRKIVKRLSFETGIIYTRLKFKVRTNDLDPFYREYRNELNYLGIPAGIRYAFMQKKNYDFYLLQWAVLEKGVSGTWFTDTYNKDVLVSSESAGENIRGIQLSTVTGLGGQMKVAGSFYLFGQGGAQVFYLNKTQPYNLRSTKKIWPSFQAGLRLKLGN